MAATHHSTGKRNTSLAFFTSHERSLLKSSWGSQATRLSRDSFLPFASCRLCLQIARDPVACAANGDLFCWECAVSNLLAQRKEIKRLEKEDDRRRREEEEEARERGEEERDKAVDDFEKVMMGLEGGPNKRTSGQVPVIEEEPVKEGRGVKRKFELDEEEMLKNAKEERLKARKALDDEKVLRLARYLLCNFTENLYSPQSRPFLPSGFLHLHRLRQTRKSQRVSNSTLSVPPHRKLLRTHSHSNYSSQSSLVPLRLRQAGRILLKTKPQIEYALLARER